MASSVYSEQNVREYYSPTVQEKIKDAFNEYVKTLDRQVGDYLNGHPEADRQTAWRTTKSKLDNVWFSPTI